MIMLALMLKERHHLKAHLTDESMFGTEFGGSRRGRTSRMSNASFDRMSQSRYSNYSGSQMSGSRMGNNSHKGGRRGHHGGSGQNYSSYQQQQEKAMLSPTATTMTADSYPMNGTSQLKAPVVAEPNSLLDYFSSKPPMEDEVDVDGALADQHLDYPQELQVN